jgi:phosphoglycerate kinase
MDKVALGKYVAGQFDGPLMRCIRAELVVFSGLKADKLDDLEAMLNRGTIRWIFAAGSLAMALKKAEGLLEGRGFCTGVAEDPSRTKEGFYIAPGRFEQARRMLETGRRHGTRFVLPVDFVLADGRVAETLAPADQQFDVGPRTSGLFSQKIGEFLLEVKNRAAGQPAVAFYNGVFGMFEDPRFEGGTRRFIPELKRMTQAGVEVFVGGGEGGTALERYGQPDWVSHTFTAGGTVLNAIGSEPVPYLVALAARISMQG